MIEVGFSKAFKAHRILYPFKLTAVLGFRAERRQGEGYLRSLPVIMLLMANAPGQRPKIGSTNHRINTGGKRTPERGRRYQQRGLGTQTCRGAWGR